ncbi:MAG: BatD family protein [Flavobacteriales bacterium]
MKKNLLFLVLLLTSFVIHAQTVFTATVNKNKVGLNEQFSLTYTVNDSGDRFQAPVFSDFTVLSGPSTSSSTTIINGKVSKENSYTYYLRAKKVGLFTIGSASIRVNGKQYRSSTTLIQVLKSSPKNSTNNTPLAKAKENVFLELELSNLNPYVGEQIIATYNLYFENIQNPDLLEMPTYKGFWHEDYDLGDNYSVKTIRRNGKSLKVITLKKSVLIPQRSGSLDIGSMDLEVPVAIPTNQRDFFGRTRSRTVNIICSSGNKSLKVKPLPSNGKPSNFTGAVGEFQFTTKLDRDSIQINESATLSMRVSGTGNLRMLDLPSFDIPNNLEAYDPKFTESIKLQESGLTGFKRVEYLLIPRNRGTYKLNSGSFNYFNPKTKKYVTIDRPSYTLTVEGEVNGKSNTVVLNNITKEDVSFIGKDILYIKTSLNDLKSSKQSFFGSFSFITLLIIPIILVIIALILVILLRKSIIDIQQWKNGTASKQAIKTLKLNGVNPHIAIVQALQTFFYKKWNLDRAKFDKELIEELLIENKVDPVIIDTVADILEKCEMARFTNVQSSEHSQASSLLSKTKDSIEKLDNY